MIIEVTGTSTRNKGAELMLVAIQDHYSSQAGVQLAVDQFFGSYADRCRYSLLQKVVTNGFGRSRVVMELMPGEFRRAFGLVRNSEVDVLLDASGFAFGDQHPADRTIAFASRIEAAKAAGKKVVLLPQAFGPFERSQIREGIQRIIAAADLVFARDGVSLQHIQDAVGLQAHVRHAPDITITLNVESESRKRPAHNRALLVPNARMMDKVSPDQARRYVPFLGECVKAIELLGMDPVLLLHDAIEDHEVARAVQQQLGREIPLIRDSDPLKLKELISQARLLIGSRFHSLVAALSQGVPALAAGWSHKYDMLMADFQCDGMLLSPSDGVGRIIDSIRDVIVREDEICDGLAGAKERLVSQLEAMWDDVDSQIGLSK